MASHGSVEQFDPAKHDWDTWELALQSYLLVNQIEEPAAGSSDRRKAALCAMLGHRTLNLLNGLCVPGTVTDKAYDELLTLLRAQFRPKRTNFATRQEFFARKQRPNESVSTFAADLRRLLGKCGFQGELDDRLIDQLTSGLANQTHRLKLVEKLDDMTATDRIFARVLTIAERMESLDKTSDHLPARLLQCHQPFPLP